METVIGLTVIAIGFACVKVVWDYACSVFDI